MTGSATSASLVPVRKRAAARGPTRVAVDRVLVRGNGDPWEYSMRGGVLPTGRVLATETDLSFGGGGTGRPAAAERRGRQGRIAIVDVRTTWIALAIGVAVLVIAFGLVGQIEGDDPAWRIALILALSVVLFLGCALFSFWLARAAFLTWRRAGGLPTGAHDASSRRERPWARDDRAE